MEIKEDGRKSAGTMDKHELLVSNAYRNGYLKRLQGKELTEIENAALSGQSVIPTQTMDMIVEKIRTNIGALF